MKATKAELANIMYKNQTPAVDYDTLVKNRIENAVKDAYWHVLINCPEDHIHYVKEKEKVILAIYKYFLKDQHISKEKRQFINKLINDKCFITYGLPFTKLKNEQIYLILYEVCYQYITSVELMEFFRNSCKNYPTHYCIHCRKYSAIDVCNK